MGKHYQTLEHEVWLPFHYALGPIWHKWFEGLKSGKLLGTKCSNCSKILVPARSFCPDCYADMNEWVEVPPTGTLITWTTTEKEFFGKPKSELKYIPALIRLDNTDCDFLHFIGGINNDQIETIKKQLKNKTKVKAVWSKEKKGNMFDIKYFIPYEMEELNV